MQALKNDRSRRSDLAESEESGSLTDSDHCLTRAKTKKGWDYQVAACRIIHNCHGVVGVLRLLFYCCLYHHHTEYLLSLIIKKLKKGQFLLFGICIAIFVIKTIYFCYAIVLVFATSSQSWICRVFGIRANLYLLFLPWQFVNFFGMIYLGKKTWHELDIFNIEIHTLMMTMKFTMVYIKLPLNNWTIAW